ncbi:MAG: glycine zipper 2TM domain-containing protein [Xanthomonadales bacterium]|nr:glycine zipper 2TM domain-containing protein [Xanthomonadales bacterium]
MNRMLVNALNMGIAVALTVGISGCNRDADAGIAGNIAPSAAGTVAESNAANPTPAARTAPSAQYAKVVSVTPVRESTKVPKQVCSNETVTQAAPSRDEHNLVGTAIGAVAGGLLGNQVGGGKGKTLATVAGAVGGGYAGNRIEENRRQTNTTSSVQQHCETVQVAGPEKIVGYDVAYVYNGVTRTVRMDHDPGDRVQVKQDVSVVPVSR